MSTGNHTKLRQLTSETIRDVTETTENLSFIYISINYGIANIISLVKDKHPLGCLRVFYLLKKQIFN